MGPVTPHTPGCFVGAARGRRGCRGVSGGWCAAQGGPCAVVRLCVWAWRGGVTRRKSARRVRAGATLVPPRPPGHERGGPAVCVFVRHTARRRLWGVGAACEEAAGKRRASPVRRYTAGGGPPPAQRRMCVRAFAGLRGCGAPHGATSVCGRGGGGHYQRTKRKPTGGCARSQQGGGVRLGAAPRSRREGAPAQAPRASGRKKNARKAAAHGSTGAEGAFRASESGEGGLVRGDVNHGTKRGGKKRTAHLAHFAHFF